MIRPLSSRVFLFALLLVPAEALFDVGPDARAQRSGGPIYEKTWRCSKCGGFLGNGVSPPSSCHHCNAKISNSTYPTSDRRPSSGTSKSKDGTPVSGAFVLIVIVVVAVGLGVFIMNSSNKGS